MDVAELAQTISKKVLHQANRKNFTSNGTSRSRNSRNNKSTSRSRSKTPRKVLVPKEMKKFFGDKRGTRNILHVGRRASH
jgi:hypothetical protein